MPKLSRPKPMTIVHFVGGTRLSVDQDLEQSTKALTKGGIAIFTSGGKAATVNMKNVTHLMRGPGVHPIANIG